MDIRNTKTVAVSDWDELVRETYGRPYSFQQQDGCKSRGVFYINVPSEDSNDYKRDLVSEIVNHCKRSSFKGIARGRRIRHRH